MPKRPFYRYLLEWMIFTVLLFMICLSVFGYFVYNRILLDLPDIKSLHDVQYQTPLTIYSSDRLLIGKYGEQNRIPLPIDQIPKTLVNAFLAAEDERFFSHPGVDLKGLIRAGMQLALTGKKSQGGSTITMQVTRNFLLSNEKTYIRKLKEIILALKMEREYTKNEILELYLNQIYMGHRSYGVYAAAQTYYNRPLSSLTLAEFAMIAGLPKAPSAINPITNVTKAIQRRNYVLQRMLELNYITGRDFKEASNQPSTARLQNQPVELAAPYVAEMARQALVKQYGEKVYDSGFKVFTSIKGPLQKAAGAALAQALHSYDERRGYRPNDPFTPNPQLNFVDIPIIGDTLPASIVQVKTDKIIARLQDGTVIEIPEANLKWLRKILSENRSGDRKIINPAIRVRRLNDTAWEVTRIPDAEGAFVALNSRNGAILALAGGFDFYRNQFNRATQSKRQPGSGFKPFIYAAALEEGFTPASLINDAPLVIEDPTQEVEWRPENYNRNFLGPTTLRKALTHSSNVISVRLLEEIGIEKARSTARRFGFSEQQLPKTPSIALGSGYASPLQMAQAYAAFANNGFLIEPYFIERIESKDGHAIFQANPKVACPECEANQNRDIRIAPRILSPQVSFLMNTLLRDVVQNGTAADAKILGRRDLAGKTGTTNGYRDAWFNGYSSDISASAWIGFDNYQSLGNRETGGKTALPMWIEFMKTALKNLPETPLSVPPGIAEAFIDPDTGRLAPTGSKKRILEYFPEGLAPGPNGFSDDSSTAENPAGNDDGHDTEKAVDQPVEALF